MSYSNQTGGEDNIPLKVIKEITFSVLSPDVIRKMSVMEVTTSETYDEAGNPVKGGLMDRRLGVDEPEARCETCGNDWRRCPGHFGRIELTRPVIHPEFVKPIYDILRATCPNCGRLKLTDEEYKRYSERIKRLRRHWRVLADRLITRVKKRAAARSTCPHCGAPQPKIKLDKPFKFYIESEGGKLTRLDPIRVREWLEKIPDDDLELLGWNPSLARPEWAVLTVLPVPPPQVRPSIQLPSGQTSADDLTHALTTILRYNEKLRNAIESGSPTTSILDLWDSLQANVATYIDNELPGGIQARHRSKRPLKGIAQRLKGKEGRFRGSLSGKRVEFSARTVISPDPNLSINEVGVPMDIARELTVVEPVTEWNIDLMRQLIINGPETWPGANRVITPDGKKIELKVRRDRSELAQQIQPGWKVERHLMDGDYVLFNRQPSLHKMSMMCHVVKVLPGRTFRLHLAVCPPYNADFDGDEMNLHVPQTPEARAEAKMLMLVQNFIITPRYGGPIIGARQDYISGGYLLARKGNVFTKDAVSYLMGAVRDDVQLDEPAIMHPIELWTGKQVISALLPRDFNFTQATAFRSTCKDPYRCDTDEYIVVVNGYLATGVLDKKSIGAEQVDSLLHVLVKRYGNEFGRRWIDSMFRLILRFMDMRGFTMALDSLNLPEEAMRRLDEIKDMYIKEAYELLDRYYKGALEAEPGKTVEETLEDKLAETLSKIREEASKIVDDYMSKESEVYIMAKSGARGSLLNAAQMTAALGQQTIRGERFRRGFTDRTLSHFLPGDKGPEARGFVKGNFRDGLSPIEYFFHAAGGRDGLVETAVRTSQSGYAQRRLINAMQDIYIAYDGTVRDSQDAIIQFKYGEDGIDVSKSDHGKLNVEDIIRRVVTSG
ncbi:MAG: DNA-directed RNA polymerase subunit A' [Caldivirga sp. MG_3]|jgi:DNA-directed RNA polymerase subunit A'|nr:MAG: DNA-directed RNA polymerase subunit A' [Caldivirga sp. MG_3]